MFLDFSVKNHECFREESYLSLLLPSHKTKVPQEGLAWAQVTSRVAAIFGANASGKTTLLRAIQSLIEAVCTPGTNLYHPYATATGSG